jgi:hypothetical protein
MLGRRDCTLMGHPQRRDKLVPWLASVEWAFPLRGRWLRYFLAPLGCVGLCWLWVAAPKRLLTELGALLLFAGLLGLLLAAVFRIEEGIQVGKPGRGLRCLRVTTALIAGGALLIGLAQITKRDPPAAFDPHQLDIYAIGSGYGPGKPYRFRSASPDAEAVGQALRRTRPSLRRAKATWSGGPTSAAPDHAPGRPVRVRSRRQRQGE